MGYIQYEPDTRLTDWVKCFWSIDDPASDVVQEVWPDGCVELVFSPGNNFLVNADGSSRAFPKVFVVGLQTEIIRVRTEGEVRLLGARMYPLSTGGWDCAELETIAAHIEEHMRVGAFPAAVSVLQTWLLHQPKTDHTLKAALNRMYSTYGNTSVSELAASQEVSARQLQRVFADRIGISPKTLARVVRFAESWSRLLGKPDVSLADLAIDLGYSDQAHFANEFKSFGHKSPRSFRDDWRK